MCDTFVALGSATRDGSVIFGKNSDRPYDEQQPIVYIPRQSHSAASDVKCTYISVPQVEETYAVLLSKPSWMFGAEMGANECDVVIGNEAVWTKEPNGLAALLGMDMVRLALERASTSTQAVHLICDFLEMYGQGGACAENDPSLTYHNSFLITDSKEAWVLETAGSWWIAQSVKDGFRNISNGLSIRSDYDIAKEGIVDYAIDQGYCDDTESFDFAECFSYGIYQEPSKYTREGWGNYLLRTYDGEINLVTMMDILRDHSGGICMHGGFRTTASQVSYVSEENTVHWLTGSPHPCISIFKPFVVPTKAERRTIDIWNQREKFLLDASNSVIKKLFSYERELIQRIMELSQTIDQPALDVQNITDESIQRELTLIS
ncbi:MAG: C69 family dipeptidase [Candidatus Heimdallarchaeota archaeon]|nr:MAG: C69 family dipeptidase [Candidatus Heimdallarchaeota archaeon]